MESFMKEKVKTGEFEKEFKEKWLDRIYPQSDDTDVVSAVGSSAVAGAGLLAGTVVGSVSLVGGAAVGTIVGVCGFKRDSMDPLHHTWGAHIGHDLGGFLNQCTIGVLNSGAKKLYGSAPDDDV
eukprot:gnl/TRDRNA2_/TRDRNA2_145180_c0_seq1.p1 gnl/TRDRNA2_/TRDRNA2_145180_c0~~gnl/TRDRNA2_/TRDRNA2_145180_c0_seq1.p1  ORF type:complete len:124 (+),score=21.68 gnl/TRDRNA2_/TRDRNA2_145180_c0_seq1:2-373(+)